MAEWHSFAKLRMHTIGTLDRLEMLTKEFGLLMRKFKDLTCSQFVTTELPREAAARLRQQQHAHNEISSVPVGHTESEVNPSSSSTAAHRVAPTTSSNTSSRRVKPLNLLTPKFHFLGDYVQTIWMFGPINSFSTQVVSYLCCERFSNANSHS
jgi:hypothetical protein